MEANDVCAHRLLRQGRSLRVLFASVFLLGLACCAAAALAEGQDLPEAAAIEGDWLVQSRDAIIRIEREGDQYQGHIVWQLHDTYGPEDGPALNGKIVTDRNNPDPALRARPLTGLRLLWGLHYEPDHHMWVDGRVYDSDNGKTYHCQIHLQDNDHLILRGFIGISLLGGSTTWTRTKLSDYTSDSSPGGAH